MIETIVAVREVGAYAVEATCDDGVVRRIDLEPYLAGEIFRPLRDPTSFARVVVDDDAGTIVWPNGADFAPEFLSDGESGPPSGYFGGDQAPAEDAVPALADLR